MNNVKQLFQPNEERREKVKTLSAFFDKENDGAIVSWLDVESKTGIKMDTSGKMLVAYALKRSHRRYIALPGRGIELQSAGNAVEIVQAKARRVASAVEIARETTEDVSRHLPEMTEEAKQRLLLHQATFAALDLSASLSKRKGLGK